MHLRPLLAIGFAAPLLGAALLLSHGGGPHEHGRLYVADLRSSDVHSFDLAQGRELSRQAVAEDPHELTFAAGSAWTSNYRSTAVTRLIAGDSATEQLPVPGEPHGLAVVADGRIAVTQGRAGEVALLDPQSGDVTAEVAVGGEPHMAAAQGDRLYVVEAAGNQLVEIDPQSASVTRRVPVGMVPESLAVSPDGRTIAVANSRARSVSLIDVASFTQRSLLMVPGAPVRVAYSPDGRTLAVSLQDQERVALLDAATGRQQALVHVGVLPDGLAFSADGAFLYVALTGDHAVAVLRLHDRRITHRIQVGDGPSGLLLVP